MLSKEDKKKLLSKLSEFRKEITAMRLELNKVNEEKESQFAKRKEYSSEIRSLIRDIKDNRNKRNEFTKEVKLSKDQRKKLNDEIKKKIDEVKGLNTKKNELLKKHGITGDPLSLQKEIDQIEFKIETNIMSFENEKKLMKLIKDKKKKLQEFKKVGNVWDEIQDMSNRINDLKQKADDTHRQLQDKASASQLKHEALIENSKKIKELRENEKKANTEFLKLKEQFNDLNIEFKNKLKEMADISAQLEVVKTTERKAKKQKDEEFIENKKDKVKEKIKKGKKLTTEDLLVFQGMDSDDSVEEELISKAKEPEKAEFSFNEKE